MACLSIILKKMLNRVGARAQPCFTPLAIGKGSERLLFNLTRPRWSSCSWMTILRNFGGQSRRSMISQVSNALVRSTNVTYSPLFCSRHFSWSCLRTKTMSVVPRFALKPHWVSGRWSSAMIDTSPFMSTREKIFPAMESRMIPR